MPEVIRQAAGPTLADPWKRTASIGDGAVYITAASNPGFPIVWTDTPERAEFVLKACQSHDQSVDLLRVTMDTLALVAKGEPMANAAALGSKIIRDHLTKLGAL